ncbi:GNAT family N-acetyltransferase [Nonomuraea lactucae]|uniref:GNAT family N-acetyltransferase n=1 Tax=Nonomuraea lactucae TaxID=2249762 RepID=UPI0013B46660|nr:GNAT family N-acetyltransferase [Nonomuraea lactucae]
MDEAAEAAAGHRLRPVRLETDAAAVSALMVEYLTWASGRLLEEYGVDSPTDLDSVSGSLGAYTPPTGSMTVAEQGGDLIAVGALRTLTPGVVEVKRMYVAPRWRARRLGSAILDHLLREAHETLRATTVRLDTCRFMADAQRLYLARGFVERGPYEGTEIPPHLQQYWRFFELDLS